MMAFHDPGTAEYKALRRIGQTETKWLVQGVRALENSKMLQEKLGRSFSAASTVADLLRRRESERVYNDTLDTVGNLTGVNSFTQDARRLINQAQLIND